MTINKTYKYDWIKLIIVCSFFVIALILFSSCSKYDAPIQMKTVMVTLKDSVPITRFSMAVGGYSDHLWYIYTDGKIDYAFPYNMGKYNTVNVKR